MSYPPSNSIPFRVVQEIGRQQFCTQIPEEDINRTPNPVDRSEWTEINPFVSDPYYKPTPQVYAVDVLHLKQTGVVKEDKTLFPRMLDRSPQQVFSTGRDPLAIQSMMNKLEIGKQQMMQQQQEAYDNVGLQVADQIGWLSKPSVVNPSTKNTVVIKTTSAQTGMSNVIPTSINFRHTSNRTSELSGAQTTLPEEIQRVNAGIRIGNLRNVSTTLSEPPEYRSRASTSEQGIFTPKYSTDAEYAQYIESGDFSQQRQLSREEYDEFMKSRGRPVVEQPIPKITKKGGRKGKGKK
jgi:hypothetical protein